MIHDLDLLLKDFDILSIEELKNKEDIKVSVDIIISELNKGNLRVADKINNVWVTNQALKKAIMLYFALSKPSKVIAEHTAWYDKIPSRFNKDFLFEDSSIRSCPTSYVRYGAYIGNNVVIMPSFINIGAYIGSGTMVDTWATIGSCAQIGELCHISGGVGIGGVLEPINGSPVIIEDNCFIGARSEIAEGVIVKTGSVISMGVYLGASTKIVNRATGEIHYGVIPEYSVVVPGVIPDSNPSRPLLYCAVIVKTVTEETRRKVSINHILRS